MDDPDRIAAFGDACMKYSRKKGAAVLLSVRVNYVIRTLQPFIGPVQWVQTSPRYALSQTPLFVCEDQQVFGVRAADSWSVRRTERQISGFIGGSEAHYL